MAISLELYKVFYYAARAGSISKAAKELYISQPAVSQSIKLLEDNLGGQLFFRTSKGIEMTKEGEVLFQYIEQAYGFILMAENKFFEMQNLMSGEIRIGASDMSCKYFLLPYLEEFHKLYPQVNIKVTNGPTPVTTKILKRGQVDFGLVSLPMDEDEGIEILDGMKIQDCFVCGEEYKHLCEEPISLKELERYPILMLEPNCSTRRFIDEYASRHGVRLKPEIELATSDLLVQFAKRGLGISCVVRDFALEELNTGKLYEIKLKEEIPTRRLAIAVLKKVPLSMAAKAFLSLMKQ